MTWLCHVLHAKAGRGPCPPGRIPAPPDRAGGGAGLCPRQLPDQCCVLSGPRAMADPSKKKEKEKLLSFGVRVRGRGPVQVTPSTFPGDGPFQLRLQHVSGSPVSRRCPQSEGPGLMGAGGAGDQRHMGSHSQNWRQG